LGELEIFPKSTQFVGGERKNEIFSFPSHTLLSSYKERRLEKLGLEGAILTLRGWSSPFSWGEIGEKCVLGHHKGANKQTF
jgi:hypothetical protein